MFHLRQSTPSPFCSRHPSKLRQMLPFPPTRRRSNAHPKSRPRLQTPHGCCIWSLNNSDRKISRWLSKFRHRSESRFVLSFSLRPCLCLTSNLLVSIPCSRSSTPNRSTVCQVSFALALVVQLPISPFARPSRNASPFFVAHRSPLFDYRFSERLLILAPRLLRLPHFDRLTLVLFVSTPRPAWRPVSSLPRSSF